MTDATIESLKRQLVRRASRAIVGGFRPSDDPFASWFGKVNVAMPGEDWPTSADRPMMPLCQFNLSEVPFRPETLSDVAFLTIFIDQQELPINAPNGDKWLLRAYPTLDGLVPLEMPADRGFIKPFPIRWELIEEDYPCKEEITFMPMSSEVRSGYRAHFRTHDGSKIGGWPSLIQSEICWGSWNQHSANPQYVFQIDTEPKAHWGWGDSGVGYFGRGTGDARDVWTLEWQCY